MDEKWMVRKVQENVHFSHDSKEKWIMLLNTR